MVIKLDLVENALSFEEALRKIWAIHVHLHKYNWTYLSAGSQVAGEWASDYDARMKQLMLIY